MKKRIIIAAAVVAAAVVTGVFIVPRYTRPQTDPETSEPPVVQAVRPQRGHIEVSRSLIGSVEPSNLVNVIPMAAGEITAVHVNVGDYVTEGQLLCEIDTKQVEAARLQMEAAEIQLNDAETNLERMQVLYASGDIAAQAYEQVESAAKAAQIQYDSAKLAYDYQIEFSQVTASIAGRIESSSMEVHGMATQSSPLCVISGDGARTISFSVTEAMLDHVRAGEPVRVEKNGSTYEGTVTEVSTMVNSYTGLFDAKATLEEADALISGSTVRLYVTSQEADNALTLPVDAVYYDGGRPYVYTYQDGTVHEVPVETGISDDTDIEIVSGLTEDDLVIITWSPELYENAPAVLKEGEAE